MTYGAYLLFAKNMCANSTVMAFLTTGQRPRHDVTCAAEAG
ncbi:alpha/beta hydrolase [Micromonospora chokoriensis]